MLRLIFAALLVAVTFTASAEIPDKILNLIGMPTSKDREAEKQREEVIAAKAKRVEEEKAELERINKEDAAAEKRRDEHNEAVRVGNVAPATIDDLEIFYEYPEDGWDLVASPKLDADGGLYIISGVIQQRKDGFIFCLTVPESRYQLGNYFAIKIHDKTKKPSDIKSRLRINGRIFAVGLYLRNLEYTTVASEQKIMPIFDAAHVILPED